jgi:hypothetical protein
VTIALIDDQALSAVLRQKTPRTLRGREIATTGYWYVRLCQAALGSSGHAGVLSGPFAQLSPSQRERAVDLLLELPDEIQLLSLRSLGPGIARLRSAHQLNIMSIEVVAAAKALGAEVFLSAPSPKLEIALEGEGCRWSRLP